MNRPQNLSQTKGLTEINSDISGGCRYISAIRCIRVYCSEPCQYKIYQGNTCYHSLSNKHIPGDYDNNNARPGILLHRNRARS